MGLNPASIKVDAVDPGKITESVKYAWYKEKKPVHPYNGEQVFNLDKKDAYSFVKAPRYDGKPMEVGPLARMIISKNPAVLDLVSKLIGAGAASVALGFLWGLQFPVIKRIWTSSFCLVASGYSAIMLGIFHLIVDVWRRQNWCVPFLWIGANALAAYLAVNLIDFPAIAARFVGGDVQVFLDTHLAKGVGGLLIAIVGLTLPMLLVRFLYQRKIFIRL